MKFTTQTSAIALTLSLAICSATFANAIDLSSLQTQTSNLDFSELQDVTESNFDAIDENIMILRDHKQLLDTNKNSISQMSQSILRSSQIDEDIGTDIKSINGNIEQLKRDISTFKTEMQNDIPYAYTDRSNVQQSVDFNTQRSEQNQQDIRELQEKRVTVEAWQSTDDRARQNQAALALPDGRSRLDDQQSLIEANRADINTNYHDIRVREEQHKYQNAYNKTTRNDLTDLKNKVEATELIAQNREDQTNTHLDNLNSRLQLLEQQRDVIAAENAKIKLNNEKVYANNNKIKAENEKTAAVEAASVSATEVIEVKQVNHNIGAALSSVKHSFVENRGSIGVGLVGGVGGSTNPAMAIGAAYRISQDLTASLTISNSIYDFDIENTAYSLGMSLSF